MKKEFWETLKFIYSIVGVFGIGFSPLVLAHTTDNNNFLWLLIITLPVIFSLWVAWLKKVL